MSIVLVAPSDWGLGHATRCVPIIETLLQRGHEVILGGSGRHIELLTQEFPGLQTLWMPNYAISYTRWPLLLKLKFPFLVARVYQTATQEHRHLANIVAGQPIDAVVSDQRFGCFHHRCRSIYISHQLCVLMPPGFSWLERIVARKLRHAAQRFHSLWIPDFAGETNLTGALTRRYPLPRNHRFVGPLSRLTSKTAAPTEPCDLLVLLSGPEPQRSMFERRVLSQVHHFPGNVVILRGKPASPVRAETPTNTRVYDHLPADRVASLIRGSRHVIASGGYSSIMDLVALGAKAVLVPTPGQTEQEHLCSRLHRQGLFVSREQRFFQLAEAIEELSRLPTVSRRPFHPEIPLAIAQDLENQAAH